MRFLFIGHGRLAKHFSAYLNYESVPHKILSRRSDVALDHLIREKDVLCLSVADKDLPGLAEKYRKAYPRNKIIHFSGSQTLAEVPSYHPLMTFSHNIYPAEVYRRMPVIGEIGQETFAQVFAGLKNPYFAIPAARKSQYHALVSMAANFPQLIWREIATEFSAKLGLDFSVLGPLLLRSLENSLEAPQAAPTGPIVRGDLHTITNHLDSIDRRDLQNIYYAVMSLRRELLFPNISEAPNVPN